MGEMGIPFGRTNVLLEGEDLERLLRATLAEDEEHVLLAGLHGPASRLQVVIAEGDRLRLLPLEVKHVDCGLIERGDMLD